MGTTDNQSSGVEMELVPTCELPSMLEPNDLREQRRWGQRIFSAMRTAQLRVFDKKGAPVPYSDDDAAIRYLLVGEVNAWLDRVAPALAFRLRPQDCLVPKDALVKTLRHHRQAGQCNRDQERQMSFAIVSELPQMLFDEQHADACNVKYHLPEDVFDLDKWDALVRAACATGGLPTTDGCMANIVDVNDWLTSGDPGLWKAFQLHNPLLSDMDGMFEREYAALPAAIKERISLIFHFCPWDSLSPQERWDKVCEIDVLSTPKCRLRFALGDVVFWGERIGPLQTLSAAAERELQEWKNLQANQPSEKDLRDKRIGEIQQWVNRIESLKDLMLIGCISDADDIGELVKLLQAAVGQPWCCNVRFPVWLDQFKVAQTVLADQRNDSTGESSADARLAIVVSDFPEMRTPPTSQLHKPVEPRTTSQQDAKTKRRQPGKHQQQEEAILSAIRDERFDPKKIPTWTPGTPGLKAKVQEHFDIPGPIFQSILTFDKAWERLRRGGENARIQDERTPLPQKQIPFGG